LDSFPLTACRYELRFLLCGSSAELCALLNAPASVCHFLGFEGYATAGISAATYEISKTVLLLWKNGMVLKQLPITAATAACLLLGDTKGVAFVRRCLVLAVQAEQAYTETLLFKPSPVFTGAAGGSVFGRW